jgi:nucleotide sugar dehydrogenase
MNLLDKKVAVIGLGYVGLPLAALCAKKGYQVVGLDANKKIVASLAEGKCHIRDEAVERLMADAIASNNLKVTSDNGEISDCCIYLICVPTPVDANNEPDLSPLESACRVVAPHLAKDDLVVVESTVFPGTCEQVVAPLLEEISGLNTTADCYLAHCPERVNPGDLFWTSENIPRG